MEEYNWKVTGKLYMRKIKYLERTNNMRTHFYLYDENGNKIYETEKEFTEYKQRNC